MSKEINCNSSNQRQGESEITLLVFIKLRELNSPPPDISLGSDDLFDATDPVMNRSPLLHHSLHTHCQDTKKQYMDFNVLT